MKRISTREVVAADKGEIREIRTSDKLPGFVWSYTFEDPAENNGYPVTNQRIHRTREDAQVALDHFIRTGIVNKPDGSTYHFESRVAPKASSLTRYQENNRVPRPNQNLGEPYEKD
jgi:hypothetical protein